MTSMKDYVETFLRLFRGLEDRHAIQTNDGGYLPKLFPIRPEDVENHLFKCVTTLGLYLLNNADCVFLACIDIDVETQKMVEVEQQEGLLGRQRLMDIAKEEARRQSVLLSNTYHLPNAIETSARRGYHIWVFFRDPIPAKYIFMLKDKIVLPRNPAITSKWSEGMYYEFFPKQAYSSGKGYGNLIKLPLGKHRVSKQYSYFLDPSTMEKVEHQLDFLLVLDKNYRVKTNAIEEILGEKIVYEEVKTKEGNRVHKSVNHLHHRFEIEIPDDKKSFQPILDEMLNLVKPYPPMVLNENNTEIISREHIDKCPPCVWRCYWVSKNMPSQFESRTVLVKYFANVRRKNGKYGFDPNEIAGFFKWEVNDNNDNKSPELLKYYTAYYYGEVGSPSPLFSCNKLQKMGFCINFDYIPTEGNKINEFIDLKNEWKTSEELLNINRVIKEKQKEKEEWESDINTNVDLYKDLDASALINDLEIEITTLQSELAKQSKTLKEKFKIKCERLWSPFSVNNEYDKMVHGNPNSSSEDKEKVDKDFYHDSNPDEEDQSKNITDILEELDSKDKKKDKEIQTAYADEFAEINKKSYETLDAIKREPTKVINEIQKTTRVGVTTSLMLSSKLQDQHVLLLEPTNAIGLDTFSKTVKISEEKYNDGKMKEPIYGGVFGSNLTMCLKLYKKIEELIEEFKSKGIKNLDDLALFDLPFLFKETCIKRKEDGTTEYCPYYNCIHVGFPTYGNEVTPIIKSAYQKEKKGNWCQRYHRLVNPTDKCYFADKLNFDDTVICKKCPKGYFIADYKYLDQDSIPICGYASVFRHLKEDVINIRVLHKDVFDITIFEKNKSDKLILLPRNRVIDLIKNYNFISENASYSKIGNSDKYEGLLTEDGDLKNDIDVIYDIKLKNFDALVMTYTKVVALYQSIDNLRKMGLTGLSEEIVNLIKFNSFEGVICDEVSHLVAQSPLSFGLYSIGNKLDDYGNKTIDVKSENCFERIDDELDKLKEAMYNDDDDSGKREDKTTYFTALKDRFQWRFGEVNHWVFNPSEVMEWFTRDERNELLARGKKDHKTDFEIFMDDIIKGKKTICYERLKEKVEVLETQRYLDGLYIAPDKREKYNRNIVRYIDVYNKRAEMKKIAVKLRRYYKITHSIDDEDDSKIKFKTDKLGKDENDIENDKEYHTLIKQYLHIKGCDEHNQIDPTIKDGLYINDNEIGIINEFLDSFDDNIYNVNGMSIGKFEGYKPRTYIIINYAWVNMNLLTDLIRYEGIRDNEGRLMTNDELFMDMYSYLVHLALTRNIGFPNLTNLLLISNVNSFFISAMSTNEYKSLILLQSVPSFDSIVDLVLGIVNSESRTNFNNFAITTDATMPLIEMSSIFGLPTKIWKFGDPKNTCEKQLVISDFKNISTSDLYSPKLVPRVINQWQDFTGDDDVENEILFGDNEDPEKKKEDTKKYSNVNKYHIIKQENGIVEYVDISKYLMRFRLFVFINTLADKYSPSNIFIVSPNKTFDTFLTKGMRTGGNGIPLEPIFIDWLRTNYQNDFNEYLQKGWITPDPVRSQESDDEFYCFHITKIGSEKGQHNDNGDRQYYRGTHTIGTECNCRIMLAITSPTSPVNSYEWLSHFYHDRNYMSSKLSRIGGLTLQELSKALRRVELQSSAFQTFSRVKDPKAKQKSIVFAWGIGSSEFEWSKCDKCGRGEREIYFETKDTRVDKALQIQSDDIYETDMKNQDGHNMNLCYDCIRTYHANVIGIPTKRKENFFVDPKGIQDYLAFKIPIPKITSIPKVYVNENSYLHFMDSEQKMLETADLFLNKEIISSAEIRNFQDRLIAKTVETILSNNIDIDLITTEIVDEFLTYSIVDLVKRPISWKKFQENSLDKFGLENLKTLFITYKKGKKDVYYYTYTNLIVLKEKIYLASLKRKNINKLTQIAID